jgi:NhaP-type Na+/H+ or K+/H+ antiporter
VFASFIFAGVLGVTGALVWSVLLNKVRTMKNSLLTTIAFVFVIFGTAEFFGYSGAIAALAFGVTIGNIHLVDPKLLRRFTMLEPISLNEMERTFFSEVVFLLKTFFFVYIGVSITFRSRSWSLYALLVTALVFLFRLLATRLGTERSLPRPDAMRMAVMAPRGLAAAVLASLPLQANLPGGPMIQGVTYMVVLFSIGLTSVLVFLLDKTALRRLFAWIFSGSVEAPAGPEEGIDP